MVTIWPNYAYFYNEKNIKIQDCTDNIRNITHQIVNKYAHGKMNIYTNILHLRKNYIK